MATPLQRMLTRAARLPGAGAGLGNSIDPFASGRGRKGQVLGATRSINYTSPGQPQNVDVAADQLATQNYLNSVFVMRCVRMIAETIAGLPFVTGMDPFSPSTYNPDAPLARLLGPSTPQAPGGPNPHLSSRTMWAWTIAQYIVTGRFAWEKQYDGAPGKTPLVALWPLVSKAIAPIPIDGTAQLWAGFQYQTPTGIIPMVPEKVMYAWRPHIDDWRMPESVLAAATIPIALQRAIDQYHVNLLKNGMVASTMVVTTPFDEADQRRSWEDQFLAEFTGIDKVGSTIFGYADWEEGDNPTSKPVQVERLAQTGMDAGLMEILKEAKIDITIALGVPESLIGNASQRTYANADSEYRNFWTTTVLNLVAEIQDHINLRLAAELGQEVGWFDLSKVAALQPPAIFAPPDVAEAINMGIVNAEQAGDLLGIPDVSAGDDSDTSTVMVGEESTNAGGRSSGWRVFQLGSSRLMRNGPLPMNSWTYAYPERRRDVGVRRERIQLQLRPAPQPLTRMAGDGFDHAQRICDQAAGLRAIGTRRRLTGTVKRALAQHYPHAVLDWVDDADWSGPTDVPLEDIEMARRPGGRNMNKVRAIAKKVADNEELPPVTLVKTPSGKLKIADDYHRTLGFKHAGRSSISAYVGQVDDEDGPWDTDMHEAKQNRAMAQGGRVPHQLYLVGERDGWMSPSGTTRPSMPIVVPPREAAVAPSDQYGTEDTDTLTGLPASYVDEVANRIHAAAQA